MHQNHANFFARRAIVFAKYSQGQGKGCVNRVCVCLCVWLVCTFAQCWFLESEIQAILETNTRRKIANPCSSCLHNVCFKFTQCWFFKLYKSIFLILFFLVIQIILGILTLTSGLNIYLASGHQITSVLLVFTAINLYYSYIK